MLKKSRNGCQCKAGVPREKLCFPKSLVMCRGLANKLKMRVSERRNVYGPILGSRRCMWQSGATPLFAAVFRSNTHTYTLTT
eukprot:9932178-Karenia_brevis.AAC.1